MLAREIGRIIVSICFLGLAFFLFRWGIQAPEPAQAMGFGSVGGTIIGSVGTYWLKPS
ncbi:hypothetical protein LCGC14_2881550 [marine sediment metagenome]|uniref:Uncharacterized protein n=1 Tax=marine sediment metagenome TaxID=412755 RepID=A0A0F8YLQ5_9ZZZZ|nr:hypothetical protein [bacterium]